MKENTEKNASAYEVTTDDFVKFIAEMLGTDKSILEDDVESEVLIELKRED